jgi:hypothetical protein
MDVILMITDTEAERNNGKKLENNVLSFQQVQLWIAVQTLLQERASAHSTGQAERVNRKTKEHEGF